MKEMQSLVLALMAAFLVACGGGGTDVAVVAADTALVPPTPVIEPPCCAVPPLPVLPPTGPVDVTLKNVPVQNKEVIPGERDVEVAAFRMAWNSQGRKTFSQMVFQNIATDPLDPIDLWKAFKNFRLVGDGADVVKEAPYQILRDNDKSMVTVDFYGYSWLPDDFGLVPKTYSLIAELDTEALVGRFQFILSAVQMHSAGVFAESDVTGGKFSITKLGDAGLPVITTNSPAYFTVPASAIDTIVEVGRFKAFCPADDGDGCILKEVRFFADNISPPVIIVGGNSYEAQKSPDGSNMFVASVGYVVAPNSTKEFVLSAIARDTNLAFWVTEMAWVVNGDVEVNPVVPPDCDRVVSNRKNCKG